MLKQKNRLKSNRAFIATYKNSNFISDDLIVLYIGKPKISTDTPVRVGFVVSKKIHKRAVVRNRIKRLMRENIRLILKNNKYNIMNNYQSFIFIAKENIIDKSYTEIRDSINTLLNKVANKNI